MKKLLFTLIMLASFAFSANLWDGSTNTTGRVETGFDDGTDTYGYWYEYTDADNAGTSAWVYPAGVEKDEYDNFFGPLTAATGGIKATATLNEGYDYPFVGFGFNISGEAKEAVDITCWNGLIVDYESTIGIAVEIGIVDEKTVTEYNNYTANLTAGTGPVTLPWAKFKQGAGWGVTIPQTTALTTANAIKFKISGNAGTSGDVFIKSVSSIADCAGSVIVPPISGISQTVVKSDAVTVKDNILNVTNSNVDVSIFGIDGSVVTKFNTSSKHTYNMSVLKPGIYMIKAGDVSKKVSIH